MGKQKQISIVIVSIGYPIVKLLLILLATRTDLNILAIYIPVLVYSFIFLIAAVFSHFRVNVLYEVIKAQINLKLYLRSITNRVQRIIEKDKVEKKEIVQV